jgi:hypothetical protein
MLTMTCPKTSLKWETPPFGHCQHVNLTLASNSCETMTLTRFGSTSLLQKKTNACRSEGPQPHIVNIQFSKKQTISVRYMLSLTLKYVGLYLDYTADESYTPQVIAVKAGTCHADLQEFCITNVEEPVGWVYISLHLDPERRKPLRTHLVQIVILKNHQLGKDTHIRQIKIFAPRPYV